MSAKADITNSKNSQAWICQTACLRISKKGGEYFLMDEPTTTQPVVDPAPVAPVAPEPTVPVEPVVPEPTTVIPPVQPLPEEPTTPVAPEPTLAVPSTPVEPVAV